MAFYLKPPRGILPLHQLQKCVEERLKFFKTLSSDIDQTCTDYSKEFLFEDSALDRAGHFTLRLAAVNDEEFKQVFIKNEVLLFQLRMDAYTNVHLLHRLIATFLRHTKECYCEVIGTDRISQFLNTCENVFTKMLSKKFKLHLFDNICAQHAQEKLFLCVPFHHCLSLLSTYSFELTNGYVKITYNNWKTLLASLYHTYLQIAINEMRCCSAVDQALADERIQLVLSALSLYGYSQKSSHVALKNTRIDAKYFPLCIQNLQVTLHKTHRLAHEERFNMSLFLKDAGMSLNESIAYWKHEYSQHAVCSKCFHTWQEDGNRYIYSIKHLYGLEGSRREYKSRSCTYLQQMILTPRQEGGCPFKHFDLEKLTQLISHTFKLCKLEDQNCKDILKERFQNPSKACHLFSNILCDLLKKNKSDCDASFRSPIQYYRMMKNF